MIGVTHRLVLKEKSNDRCKGCSPYSNDSYPKSETSGKITELKMYPKEPKNLPTSNSSSEGESCKDLRRRQSAPNHDDSATKSYKTTRKKEDLRGGGTCHPGLKICHESQSPGNQVPSSEFRRSSARRDANKTDSGSGRGAEEEVAAVTRGAGSVLVRETKASRLRAASRTPTSDGGASSPNKSSKDARKSEKVISRRDIDKSHSRKSHLNRSHTSEGVYDEVFLAGGSNVRRRRPKNLSSESSPSDSATDRSTSARSVTMGNTNGSVRDPQSHLEQTAALGSFRKSPGPLDKYSLKPSHVKIRSDDSPKTSSRRSPVDIATRAEILAASTLKMINRLDEINNKTRRTQDDIYKKSSSNSVINSENYKSHSKKVPASLEAITKSSASRPRVKNDKPNVVDVPDKRKSDGKPSILKNKPPGTFSPVGDAQKPVSILKRKSLSQDDSQSSSPPVTFSPSVLRKETDVKRQGILKKRRSLDESEVMRRRSYSPDASYDFKSILKSQRRSSMEELTRRSSSLDSAPQGILKRKSSKEEDTDEEPQGILKRKSLPCLSSHQLVKLAPRAVEDRSENVRPILKKKSSSEEHSASDPSLTEVPKSILKKKTSLESEEPEEKPMKPILKSSRSEDSEEGKRSRSSEEPKPILKRENNRSDGENVVLRRVTARSERPRSSSDIDSELSAIFLKRRSLEFQPVSAINFGLELQRTKRASSNERLRGDAFKRPLSVAEKINNLENFLEVERIERERRNSPPGTPPSSIFSDSKSEAVQSCSSVFGGERSSEVKTPLESLISTLKSFTPQQEDKENIETPSFSKTFYNPVPQSELPGVSSQKEEEEGRNEVQSSTLHSLKGETEMDAEELMLLKKSGSVSSKTSLFKELEKSSADSDVGKQKRSTGNAAVNRRFQKKVSEANSQRYHTQPVSAEDVELAVRKTKTNAAEKQDEGENHEDELCTMSYKDRLKMFESTFSPKFLDPSPRKRGVRHRTQPVTTDEVEIAKSQRRPPTVAASAVDEQNKDGGISDNSKPKLNLGNLGKPKLPEEKAKPKGILKNLSATAVNAESNAAQIGLAHELNESFLKLKKVLKSVEKETTSELKGILKQPSYEKKETSSSEEEEKKEEEDDEEEEEDEGRKCLRKNSGMNLAAILQKVEPVKGKEEERRFASNPKIARLINRSRNSSLIVKSQSQSTVPSKCGFPESPRHLNGETKRELRSSKDETDESRVGVGLRRSTTQPLGRSDESTDDDMSGASIQERLARLKKSGELDWQKRKSHMGNLETELSVITSGNYLFNEHCLLREKKEKEKEQVDEELRNSSSILADRLGKLDAAKEGWKKRIKPSDAVRFSVEGKILEKRDSLSPPNATAQISPTRTPLAQRKKRSPKAAPFKSKQCNPSLSSMPSSPSERLSNPIARSVSAPGSGKDGLLSFPSPEANGPVVTVPKNDDETFTSFFDGVNISRTFEERLEIKDEDLDAVTRMKSSQLLVQKRNIKTQKRRTTVRNPLKTLAARMDLQEYTEIKTGIAEKELKRMKIEKAAKNSSFAVEALAGLASQEDFTAVNLKKASEGTFTTETPYKDLMLLQVKGRRHVQTRLVEPVARSINSGDCFILVTPNRLFHYVGEFANVIERSRGAEISLHIQQKGDLGCTAGSVVTIGEGGRAKKEEVREFWKLLGGEPGCEAEMGSVDEDELFESALVDTNMVYEVVNDELVPVDAYWGSIPKIEVLDPNKILVFDFGSEFYVWNGKNVNLAKRKLALKVAKELWEEGYDYTDCDICPLTAASHLGARTSWSEIHESEKAGPARPEWALFTRITQNMETVLFREKFLDWPDYTRVIRKGKTKDGSEQSDSNGTSEVKPCDAKQMLENEVPEPDLVLEGSHLGRGVRYFDEETRRCSEITTKGVTVWHVNEFEYSEVNGGSVGQFHTGDSYVVRWHYVITITGRELSGLPSKHLTTGRNRYAYFFWQGRDSPTNDKGAAACLTVELDKEHGPQVRVVQGFEPPAFLNLFEGKMVVHGGRRRSETSPDVVRLFICRGGSEAEGVLFEVPSSMRQLRSLASFVLVNRETGKIIVWHGWKTPEHSRQIAVSAAKRIKLDTEEFEFKSRKLTVSEELEGSESPEFIRALGGDNRQLYYSLLEDRTELRTPRLFHLSSVSGEFLFNEIASPYLSKDTTTSLPFLQSDLYSASQPALFLLDSSFGLWLWQGWWEENSETERGSCYVRYQAERRAAMSTALTYWNLKYGNSKPRAYLIWAGLEPLVFTNQFPFWTDRDDVAEVNIKDGRKPGEAIPIKTELASLTQSTYPLSQLQNRPLPDGVNPTSLEEYLEPQCFPDVFGMEKSEFLNLPSWKKKKLKQDAGLF